MSTHVTYIRDSDRTRVVFVLEGDDALERAASLVPRGFRFAATRLDQNGRLVIPMDGDDYGADL